MKSILSIYLLCSLLSCKLSSAQTLTAETFKPYVISFSIENDELAGSGAELLLERLKETQFVLIGENHHSAQMARLTRTLIPKLATLGFNKFAVEIGPL